MPIEFFKDNGRLVWIRNPFTDTITYFTDVHRKRSGFRPPAPLPLGLERELGSSIAEATLAELQATQRECPFCPGNEHMTPEEVFRFRPDEVDSAIETSSPWLIRAFY